MLIYWLRNDFRLNDNEALSYLLSSENTNFVFFSYDKEKYKFRSAQKWWLYKTLKIFDKKLSEIGVKFIVENDLECSFLEKILKNKLSVRQTEDLIKNLNGIKKDKKFKNIDSDVIKIIDEINKKFDYNLKISTKGGKAQISFNYDNKNDLISILKKLNG